MTRNTASQLSTILSDEEYLAFERSSEIKHEFLSGHVYAMAGATREHNLITGNIAGELRLQLRGKPCETYSNDMRVRISRTALYTYPDVVVVCGTPLFLDDHRDTLINPLLIIEVLSPSTEGYDRGEKFKYYRSIESFSEYMLIAQDKIAADHFVKQDNIWTIREVEQEIRLITIPCLLNFSDIYDRVEFITEEKEPEK
jgi:Uma2 family endonuclease